MQRILIVYILFCSFQHRSNAQEITGSEIGFDGFASVTNLGGSFGIGMKYGLNFGENIIAGPSFRFQRSWSNWFGNKFAYNITGGGLFLHARYQNIVYGAVEFEMLHSPISYTVLNANKRWVPTLFVGGGFSKEFNEMVRLNLDVYYDVINHENSPFRQGYFVKVKDAQTGQVVKYVPIIYRISFFFPLSRKEKENPEEEEYDEYIEE